MSQRDPSWSGNTLGTCPNPPNSIGGYGCFTTSKAMVFNYHQPNFTDPGQLNTCLTSSGGYSSGCLANWSLANVCAPSGVAYQGEEAGSVTTLAASIDAQLSAGYPVLADVRYSNNSCSGSTGQHMVVIIGKNGSTYAIKDPWATDDTYRTLNTPALGAVPYVLCKIRKYQGPAASRQLVVSGDWNNDGRDSAWTFDSGWWVIPSTDGGTSFAFGQAGDLPVVGDWDGDGEDDYGVFRPGATPSTFYLDTNRDHVADWILPLAGNYPDDKPIAGDWDGVGKDDIGVWNAANGWFYRFRITGPSSWQNVDSFQMGLTTDAPLAGNWDGAGGDEVGVFRRGEPANTNNFYFRKADGSVVSLLDKTGDGYGMVGDVGVVGDWDGDGYDTIGVYRAGQLYPNHSQPKFSSSMTCTSFSASPLSTYPSSSSGSTTVTIAGSPAGCTGGSWSASGNGSWISVSPTSGSGSSSVTVSWTQNTGSARSGYATIAGSSFLVSQAAGSAPTCTSFSISPTSASPSSSSGSATVTITGSPAGCTGGSWSASGNGSWISVSPTSGSGAGSVTVSWTQNTGSARSGYATIAGNSLLVSQAAVTAPTCTSFSISPTSASPSDSSGSTTVTVTGSPAGCTGGNWTASGNGSWISVSPTSGSGSGSVTVSWTQNTGAQRSGYATVAGQSFAVNQASAGEVELANGTPYSDSLTAGTSQGGWKYYFIVIPSGATRLDVVLDQVSGDVDLYTNPAARPSLGTYACRPYVPGPVGETCAHTNPTPGVWWIGINNWDAGTIAYRVTATYTSGTSSPSISLDSPRDGDSLTAGSTYTIRWTSSNLTPSGSVQLWYLDNPGWQFIVSLSPSTTQYSWTVPTTDAPVTSVFVGSAVASDWEATDDSYVLVTRSTDFYTVTPCRVIDTRQSSQGGPTVTAGETRRFKLTGVCQVPTTAQAVAVNITVTLPSTSGNIRFFPASLPQPVVSVVNYAAAQTRANNAVLPIGADGSVDLKCSQASGTVEVIIDVVGYFQ